MENAFVGQLKNISGDMPDELRLLFIKYNYDLNDINNMLVMDDQRGGWLIEEYIKTSNQQYLIELENILKQRGTPNRNRV